MIDLYRGLVIFFLFVIAVLLYVIMIEISQVAVDVDEEMKQILAELERSDKE